MAIASRSRNTANQASAGASEAREDAADSTAWLRNDGVLENAITGLNDPDYDKTVHTVVASPKRLSYIDQQNLYEGSWICRRICDAYPIEGTREWVDVTLGGNAKPELATKFMQYQERLDVKDTFKLGQTWANIYKGAAAIIHVDDGREPDEPINRTNVRTITDIEVLDYLDIRPNTTVSLNPLRPDYYELVNRTNLSDAKDGQLNNFRDYHPDRIIRFDGFALPPKAMLRNQNWGGSLLDSVFTAFNRYESGNAAAANMVQDFNVFVYALKNLGNLIGANDEKSLLTLRNRLKSLRLTMSNLKGLVIDAEGEKAEFITRNFAGLADVLDRFRDELIGASGLPHTAVFGDAAGGLGSTGESEEVTWAKMVNQFQETTFRKKLRPVFELIWLAKDGPSKGKIPDDWSFSFNPLVQESEKEKLETRTAQSTIDNTYLSAGVVTKEEVRTSRFGGSDYSYETTLDEAAWKKAQEEDQFDFSGIGLGDDGGDGGAAGDAPPEDDPNGGAPAAPDNGAIANGNGNGAAVRNGKAKQDSADARKRVEQVQGLSLDVTHNVGDWRFGQPMQVEYARIRGSYGHAKDGRAHDVVKGPNPNSTKLFKLIQKNPATGLVDEVKYGIGFDDIMSARDGWASMLPGGIHSPLYGSVDDADWSELQQYRQDCSADCDCDLPVTKPANKTPLLRLRRKQKPFGRELELIEDEPEESDRTAKEVAVPSRSRASKTKQKRDGAGDSDEESDRVDGSDRTDAATKAKSKNAGKGKPCGDGSISPEKECHVGEQKPAKKGGVNPLLIGAGIAVAGLGVAAIAASQHSKTTTTPETQPETVKPKQPATIEAKPIVVEKLPSDRIPAKPKPAEPVTPKTPDTLEQVREWVHAKGISYNRYPDGTPTDDVPKPPQDVELQVLTSYRQAIELYERRLGIKVGDKFLNKMGQEVEFGKSIALDHSDMSEAYGGNFRTTAAITNDVTLEVFVFTNQREMAAKTWGEDRQKLNETYNAKNLPVNAVPSHTGLITHELGHTLYSGLNDDEKADWKRLWREHSYEWDGAKPVSQYFQTEAEEGFCETLAQALHLPDKVDPNLRGLALSLAKKPFQRTKDD